VPGSGLAFDTANGLGLSAMFALVICCWLAPATAARYRAPALHLHRWLGVLVTAAVLVHALLLLLTNDVAIEYLKWRAPAYMHAGNVGFLLLVVLCILPVRRIRRLLHRDFNQFRRLHRGLSLIAITLAAWHVLGSGYLTGAGHGAPTAWRENWLNPGWEGNTVFLWWRSALLVTLLSLTTLLWWQAPQRSRPAWLTGESNKVPAPVTYTLALVALALLYVLVLHETQQ